MAGAETRPSNPGEHVEDGPDFAHRRRLLDGREYTIVKVFHRPDGLTAALASLGWNADIRTTGPEFYYGVASGRSTGDVPVINPEDQPGR